MERRLKERLTGAIVLVALAVIVIPSLLDGPEPSPSVSQPLALPAAQATGTRSRTITLGAEPSATAETAAAVETQAPPNASPMPSPRAAAPLPSQPALTEPTASAPPPAASGGWAVQVGSFSKETNARRLAQTLNRSGYPAFVARHVVNGAVQFRVRVGPEPERERADALAARLSKDGQQTRVVPHP